MALTITDVDAVRSEGSLKSPSEAAGAATDRQIQRAIRDAWRKMQEKIGAALYTTVQGYTPTDLLDLTKDTQYEAFLRAESCFAVSFLATALNAQQLTDTGMIQSIEIGKARQSFASSEEARKISAVWEQKANRWLAPYLAVPLDPIKNTPTSFTNKNGSFYMGEL